MAREVLGVAGAIIGGSVGGVKGAQIGFVIGSTVGGIIDGNLSKGGPGLAESPIQTGRDNIPIPRGWGVVGGVHGNLIQVNPYEDFTVEEGGKGGGTDVPHRRQTYAIGVIEGPVVGIRRIWENNKLVVDTRASPAIPTEETNKYLADLRIYLGDEDQLPDPDLEAHKGVGNQPYYRGTCYVVWVDRDITDFGSSIPQYMFEVVVSADASLTSRPYPVEAIDSVQGTPSALETSMFIATIEGIDETLSPISGELMAPLLSLDYQAPEGIDETLTTVSGTLTVQLVSMDYQAPEGIDETFDPVSGTLEVRLLTYLNWPAEGIDTTVTLVGGTLT